MNSLFCLNLPHFPGKRSPRPQKGLVSRLLGALATILAVFACSHMADAQVTLQTNVSVDLNSAASTITSPSFSTPAPNELLLAFIATDSTGSTNTTVKSVTGAGLTWNLVKRTNTEAGTAEIWRAFAPTVLRSVSVTATLSESVVSSMTVSSFSGVSTAGANGSGAIGAVASGYSGGGAPAAKLVTTQNGSFVVGVGNDFDNAIARTPNSGQTLMHQDFSSTGDTYWVQRTNAPVPTKGTTITLGDSAPTTDRYNLSICEILAPTASSGTGSPQLSVSSGTLAFGDVNLNTVSTKTLTLSSTGTAAVKVNSGTLSGTGFSMSGVTFPVTLNPGQTATLQVSFDPKAAGAASGSISISSTSSTGSATTVSLSGTGTTSQVLTLSSASLNFGSDAVGTAITLPVTLTSTGTSAVTVSAASLTGAGFSFSGATFPVTLNPNVAIKVQVQFDPTAVGTASGALTFSSNSSTGSTSAVSLSGTGTAVQHQVSLSWAAPVNSPDTVTGYRVYRATGTSTTYQQVASSSSTGYVDASVQANTAYSYYVTSVGSNGTESAPSNHAAATVPK
jgi:hypothetical protein